MDTLLEVEPKCYFLGAHRWQPWRPCSARSNCAAPYHLDALPSKGEPKRSTVQHGACARALLPTTHCRRMRSNAPLIPPQISYKRHHIQHGTSFRSHWSPCTLGREGEHSSSFRRQTHLRVTNTLSYKLPIVEPIAPNDSVRPRLHIDYTRDAEIKNGE